MMKHHGIKKQGENSNIEARERKPFLVATTRSSGVTLANKLDLRKYFVIAAFTILASSQAIFIARSEIAENSLYNKRTVNFSVEALKCALSLVALLKIWKSDGITQDNKLSMSFDEVIIYSFPATFCFIHSLLKSPLFSFMDGRNNQSLKILEIISTGVLSRLILKRKLTEIQWIAFVLLCVGCTFTEPDTSSDHIHQTSLQGWVMAIVTTLLSVFVGVHTEAVIKKHPLKNVNVQNFWLSIFGLIFELVGLLNGNLVDATPKGFFYGYSIITACMILNHALSGIVVSMVLKYTDNIVKVYSVSVAMIIAAIVSKFIFDSHLSDDFLLGVTIVSVSLFLHGTGSSLAS
ncbi:CMP-sialic acid transporter 4 [Platanthera guangdongensis]|uniref:CMP-sialic acid transporter 4 n=1 Tax=Platanthera guangdongensis TaxID=2320717 RepID=A0ABR2LHN2_9ASPA